MASAGPEVSRCAATPTQPVLPVASRDDRARGVHTRHLPRGRALRTRGQDRGPIEIRFHRTHSGAPGVAPASWTGHDAMPRLPTSPRGRSRPAATVPGDRLDSMRFAATAALSVAVLGCAPGPATLRSSAWFAPTDSSDSRRPVDCSDLQPPAPAGTVGNPVEPGRGKTLQQPADLGVGPVRLVWTSTVSGVHLDWVAPAVPEARRLWLLRVADSGRCVVGVWNASSAGFQIIRHVFRNDDKLEDRPPRARRAASHRLDGPRHRWLPVLVRPVQRGRTARSARRRAGGVQGGSRIAFASSSWTGAGRPSSTSMDDTSSAAPSRTPAEPKSG